MFTVTGVKRILTESAPSAATMKAQCMMLTILCYLTLIPIINVDVSGMKYQNEIDSAVKYLVNHYNSDVGLIYESEDEGSHWIKLIENPEYYWSYQETFWIYSDNLFAAYALKPYSPIVSDKIRESIKYYGVPPSNKFEAVIGQQVGPDRAARNIIINQTDKYAILIRIHNGSFADPRFKYADALLYEALTLHYQNKTVKARQLVNEVYQMWNGSILVDYGVTEKILTEGTAPTDIGYGHNFKLALLLYTSKVTRTNLPDYDLLEEKLWSSQNVNGGIISLTLGDGTPIGSANCETTALTLLIYNDDLTARLSGYPIPEHPDIIDLLLITLVICYVIVRFMIGWRRKVSPVNDKCLT